MRDTDKHRPRGWGIVLIFAIAWAWGWLTGWDQANDTHRVWTLQ